MYLHAVFTHFFITMYNLFEFCKLYFNCFFFNIYILHKIILIFIDLLNRLIYSTFLLFHFLYFYHKNVFVLNENSKNQVKNETNRG